MTQQTSRLLRRLVTITAVAGLGSLASMAPALAEASNDYVALGDSYSAGDGGGDYAWDGTTCLRSAHSFPGQIAASKGLNLDLQACSGAVTADMPQQYAALSPGTDLVTITIGGNDVGFAPVVTECAKPSWWGNCGRAVDEAEAKINTELPGRLASVYSEIRRRAPHAQVVVAGYPRLFNGEDCSWATFFSADEMTRMNSTADLLNSRIRAAASSAGLTFVDVTSTFDGHAVCDDNPYLHNLTASIVESFHPNRAGHQAYAEAVGARVGSMGGDSQAYASGGFTVRDAKGRSVAARTGAATAQDTRRSRAYAPDLRSPEARAAAKRAGVSDRELELLTNGQERAKKGQTPTAEEKDALRRAKR